MRIEDLAASTFAREQANGLIQWSKLYAEQVKSICHTRMSSDAVRAWLVLQPIFHRSERPGYLIENGQPISIHDLANETDQDEAKLAAGIDELLFTGRLKKDGELIYDPTMVKSQNASEYKKQQNEAQKRTSSKEDMPSVEEKRQKNNGKHPLKTQRQDKTRQEQTRSEILSAPITGTEIPPSAPSSDGLQSEFPNNGTNTMRASELTKEKLIKLLDCEAPKLKALPAFLKEDFESAYEWVSEHCDCSVVSCYDIFNHAASKGFAFRADGWMYGADNPPDLDEQDSDDDDYDYSHEDDE